MRWIVWFFAAAALAQPPVQVNLSSPAPPGAQATAVVIGNPGNATYNYWVIVNYPAGSVVAASPAVARFAPASLTGSNYVQIGWTPVQGATSYDVVRAAAFSGSCSACAVATGLTVNSAQDTGGVLGNYSAAAPAVTASGTLYLNTQSYAPPQLRQVVNGVDLPVSAGGPTGPAGGDLSGTYPNPSVVKVNGGAIPASSPYVGTNSSGQVVTATAPVNPNTGIICNGSASATAATCPGVPVPPTLVNLGGTFIPGITSTGSPLTLNIAGLGAKNVYLNGTATSATNVVVSGQPYQFYYDGTQIQVSGSSGGGGTQSSNLCTNASGAVIACGFIDVQGAGAKPDGVTDNTALLNSLFSSAPAGSTIYFSCISASSSYLVTGKLNFTSGHVYAGGSVSTSNNCAIKSTYSGAVSFEFKNTVDTLLLNLPLVNSNSSSPPSTILAYGRSSSMIASANNQCINSQISGYASVSVVYSIASEQQSWQGCKVILNGGGATSAYITDDTDSSSIDSFATASNSTIFWLANCQISDFQSPAVTDYVFSVKSTGGATHDVVLRDSYLNTDWNGTTPIGYGILLGNQVSQVTIASNRIEDSYGFLTVASGASNTNVRVLGNNMASVSGSSCFICGSGGTTFAGWIETGNAAPSGVGSSLPGTSGGYIAEDFAVTITTNGSRSVSDSSRNYTSVPGIQLSSVFSQPSCTSAGTQRALLWDVQVNGGSTGGDYLQLCERATGGTASNWRWVGLGTQTGLDLAAQTAGATLASFTTQSTLGTYKIEAYATITAVNVDVLTVSVSWTDENSNAQTATLYPAGSLTASVAATGVYTFVPLTIRTAANSSISVSTILTASSGSIAYDAGATITQTR